MAENENWDFKKTFTVTDEQLQHDIVFRRVGYPCGCFLWCQILHTQNMFIGYNIGEQPRKGENQLIAFIRLSHMEPARLKRIRRIPCRQRP